MKTGKIVLDNDRDLKRENAQLRLEVQVLKQAVRDLQMVVDSYNRDFVER